MSAPKSVPAVPAALAPWAVLFAGMPEPDLRILASLMDALRPLLDRADGAGAQPQGEIDGLGGLGSRGGIERLVASEWLWRELDPDAFLQRAAARDLLTLEPVYRQSTEAGVVLVVLDAGPDLLGAPRLVALAALLCLCDLARRRGAHLLWTSTAAPERGWSAGFDRADVARLLRESAAVALDAAELDWFLAEPAATRAVSRPGASLWLVGGTGLPEGPRRANRITIAERPRLDPAGLAVAAEVAVTGPSGGAARARLDLPPEAEAVALLRDPFRPRTAPGSAHYRSASPKRDDAAPAWAPTGFAFTPGAQHLLVARRDGILVFPLLGERTARHIPIAHHDRLAGLHVGPERIRAVFVTVYLEEARIRQRSWNFAGRPLGASVDLSVPRDHPLAATRFPRAALPFLGILKRRDRCWLLAPDGAPILLAEGSATDYRALRGTTPFTLTPGALLTRDRTGAVIARRRADGHVLARFPAEAVPATRAGALDVLTGSSPPMLAAEDEDGTWQLTKACGGEVRCVYPHGRIVGFATVETNRGAGEHLAALHRNEDGLTFRDLDGAVLADPIPLPADHFDVVRIAAGPGAKFFVAAARLDPDGFVATLALRSVAGMSDDIWRYLPNVNEFTETIPCLDA